MCNNGIVYYTVKEINFTRVIGVKITQVTNGQNTQRLLFFFLLIESPYIYGDGWLY